MRFLYEASPLSLAKLSEMKDKALSGLSKLESTQLISRISLDAVKDNPLSLIFSAYIPNPEDFNDAIMDMRDVFGWLYNTVYYMEQEEEAAAREKEQEQTHEEQTRMLKEQEEDYENVLVPFIDVEIAEDDIPF